jgi:diacylglycerol kinase family enzyme
VCSLADAPSALDPAAGTHGKTIVAIGGDG